MIILLPLLLIKWHYLPGSYDELGFSWTQFFWIVIPIGAFILLWNLVIDKWLKKWEDKKKNNSK